MYLGEVQTGNVFFIEATFEATRIAPTAQSSTVTFTIVGPDGTVETVTSPHASITGPTITTLGDGRKRSVWVLTHEVLTLPGSYTIRARSTAGLVASRNDWFDVPAYVPLVSA